MVLRTTHDLGLVTHTNTGYLAPASGVSLACCILVAIQASIWALSSGSGTMSLMVMGARLKGSISSLRRHWEKRGRDSVRNRIRNTVENDTKNHRVMSVRKVRFVLFLLLKNLLLLSLLMWWKGVMVYLENGRSVHHSTRG